ncbi:PEP-CTERM sorting domain-containing protein [Pseudobythopirellula maris]|uniref:PEP-CTERM sorting domain-containing protein n=1 Tax=Pseudobythopirellula maris TaxID=2527991 RepID=UPI0011B7DA96
MGETRGRLPHPPVPGLPEGQTLPKGQTVPEPASAALLLIATAFVRSRCYQFEK